MGVITYDMEIASSISAARMYKAFVLDIDVLIPKIMPEAIKSVEILEGDGGVGTIKQLTFGEASQIKYVKQKVDAIDKENFTYSYSIVEGDVLGELFESISYHVKIVSTPSGGSICKNRSIYNTKADAKVTEEEIKAGKEKASGMFKALEAYLMANPDA